MSTTFEPELHLAGGAQVAPAPPLAVAQRTATVDVVVPTYNEAAGVEASVRRLRRFLDSHLPWPAVVTIVDNGSTDATPAIGAALAEELDGVRFIGLRQKGRGRALRAAWLQSEADVVAYTDVDLSTDLDALLPLVAPLLSGHSDIAIGTRLARGSNVARGAKREVISRGYNAILHVVAGARFSDAQCGFKAVRSDVARRLVPLVEDEAWFFDTELLLLAERNGLRIHEVPVDWADDPDSRVDVTSTAIDDLRGIGRMLLRFASGDGRMEPDGSSSASMPMSVRTDAARFAGVGSVSTLLYIALFLLLDQAGAFTANAIALTLTAAFNALGHRWLSFGAPEDPTDVAKVGGTLLAIGLVTSSAAVGVVWLLGGGLLLQLAAVLAATSFTSAPRFVVLRSLGLRQRQQGQR